jgi:hypothetical protein
MTKPLKKPVTPLGWIGGGLLLLGLLGGGYWAWQGPSLIAAAFEGAIGGLGDWVALHRRLDPEHRTLAYFLAYGMPVGYRLAAVGAGLGLWLLWKGPSLQARWLTFFQAEARPVELAWVRIVVYAALLLYTDPAEVIRMAAFPRDLLVPPPGLGWLVPHLSMDAAVVRVALWLFQGSCLLALVGLWTRPAAWGVVLLGLYVLGLPQYFGKIDHYHHLLWLAALLAASPSADAWSVDTWRRARRGLRLPDTPDPRYARPLCYAALLIGVVYFFAGFWKFVVGGVDWGTEAFPTILHAQWYRLDWLPALRPDRYPALLAAMGWGTMLWEVSFVFLLFVPRLRLLAILGGLAFHLLVYLLAGINFWSLAVCYVVFVPLVRGKTGGGQTASDTGATHRPLRPRPSLMGMLLLAGAVLCGLTQTDSWPFAVYPTFAGVREPYFATVTLVATQADGTAVTVNPWKDAALRTAIRPSRLLGLMWQVALAREAAVRQQKAVALLAVLRPLDVRLQQARSVALYEDHVAVDPGRWAEPPVRRRLLWIGTAGQ